MNDMANRRRWASACAALLAARTAAAQTATRKPQFIYILRVAPKYHDRAAWTDADNAALGRHFARLQQATERREVILAGRTNEALDKTFGVVIFEADNEAAALAFMNSDPAVEAGLMSATLHPYAVALLRKP